MNIVYHATDNYAFITCSSITSLFENNKDAEEINVYIIEHGFREETKEKYRRLAWRYGRNIYFTMMPDVNKEYGLGLKSIKETWLFDSYSRLFLDTILPSLDRVLYLDGDTLILNSLKDLWEMELGDNCCAAALDCLGARYYDLFEINKGKYCNSGVILFDLAQWRKDNIAGQIVKYVQNKNGYVFFMEQSVFNTVLQGKIAYLPAIYNTSSIMLMFTPEQLWKMRKPKYFYNLDEIKAAVKTPTIIHMTGLFYIINKPWNEVTNHPCKALFWSYFKKMDWERDEMQKDSRGFMVRMKDTLVHACPIRLLVPLVSWVYNGPRVRRIRRQMRYRDKLNEGI